MTKYLYLLIILSLASCAPKSDSLPNKQPADKSVKFLWRADKYDEQLKENFSALFIEENFCKTITDPEKAALGYVATFIGNECNWDGDPKDNRSNLKCRILSSLNLGYQCSEEHLGFLRRMFKNDTQVLQELNSENCPTSPDGATIQDTFDEILLTVNGNTILVSFKVTGVNLRDGESWTWNETDHFLIEKEGIKLVGKDKSEVRHSPIVLEG